jgi:hypothetical protein
MSSSAITGPILSDVRRSPSGSAAAPSWSFADSTGTGVYLVSAGVLGLSTNGVQRVVVNASGNVGIGTASPEAKLSVVGGNISIDSGSRKIGYITDATASSTGYIIPYDSSGFLSAHSNFSTGGIKFHTGTANTERMRIEANGNVLVGQSTFGASNNGIKLDVASTNAHIYVANTQTNTTAPCLYLNRQSASGRIVEFRQGGTHVGSISVTSTATAFNQSASDYRLKEAIAPLEGGLAKVCAMKPVSFKWKESGKSDTGFIAHELQAVIPEAISGEKDAVDAEGNPEYQAIFPAPAQLVASLVAAIQELKAELDEAKAKIAALESKP